MDDRVLIYRGADQPDMSVINPESDVWQRIKIPQAYLATNWPIRYSALSSDGRLIAVAGRRGLVHYSSSSGRWKLFADELQEQAFSVRGGLLWFHHVLIAAVDVSKSYQVGKLAPLSYSYSPLVIDFRSAYTLEISNSVIRTFFTAKSCSLLWSSSP